MGGSDLPGFAQNWSDLCGSGQKGSDLGSSAQIGSDQSKRAEKRECSTTTPKQGKQWPHVACNETEQGCLQWEYHTHRRLSPGLDTSLKKNAPPMAAYMTPRSE